MVASDVDVAAVDVAADLDLEGLDQDSLCSCDHGPAAHSEGCLECQCGALCLDLAGEGLEDDAEFETEVARVVAAVRADRPRQSDESVKFLPSSLDREQSSIVE